MSRHVVAVLVGLSIAVPAFAQPVIAPRLTLRDSTVEDQDDLCFWLHPSHFALSTIICSDKSADRVFVYDLAGNTLQSFAAQQPGNIDIRYGFPLGGQRVDLVAFNERDTQKIRVYRVDPGTRSLFAVDNGGITSGSNYGFALYRSRASGRLYAYTGPEGNTIVRQFELFDDGAGHVAGSAALRSFQPGGQVEGMVADDETGLLFVASESGGVWKYGAEPGAPITGTHIAPIGQNGLTDDVEGITIYYTSVGDGYLLVSSQGNSSFKVYERAAPHTFRGTFLVQGAASTDGIDVMNVGLGPQFPRGAFACHNGANDPYPVHVSGWEDIATPLGLEIDTAYWDPRVPVIANPVKVPPSLPRIELSVRPNPSPRGVELAFTLPRRGRVMLAIHDAIGRRVRRLLDVDANAGPVTIHWDAQDDHGRRLLPGLYVARLALDGVALANRKIELLDGR